MPENKMRMTRRRMLKLAGVGVGALAAACQPKVIVQTVEVEKVVEKQVVQTVEVQKVVEVAKEVTRVVEKAVEKEVTRVVEVEKAAKVTGTFWVLQKKDFFPAFNDWFRAEMTAWCKERGWPLDISYMAGYTGGTPEIEKLLASVAAGTPADLIMHSLGITQLRQGYALEAVTPIVEEVEAQWGKAAARQYNDFRADDQWWAVPYFQRSDGGWFQRPPFQEAGIDIHKLRLYTDLWEACLEVSKPDKELYGWGVTINRCGDGDWFRRRVMHGWGAYIQDETGRFVTFNSPQMVEAMTVMTQLYLDPKWEPMLPPGVLAWTDSSNNEAYLAGKLAYTQNGGTLYGKAVLDNNPIKDITGFHAPAGGPVNLEFNSLSANNFMILRGARNFDAAKETILHFLLPLENQDAVFKAAPAFCLPAYEKLWAASNYIKTNQTAAELEKVARDPSGVIPGQYPGPPNNPAMAAADAAGIENDMVADILRGTPVAEAVKTCHERYVKIFKEFGLPGEK
ncbi:MAG: extracellular solute-binding protein [Chloroflexi bacterium]|nr:extracellular solute-binding protein [Chloroflexota bacterium]